MIYNLAAKRRVVSFIAWAYANLFLGQINSES
jgi:hypothetical protein